ncbi:hypothetical protein GQX73_g3245 [Xylaria multiplex]|uniref:Uncharacterized protein n=1 Tax=Xylaria multiplex TaxID=323545 RepID=A0A7C8NA54_9PEZI|nr:hypothetical protein GQX73_g3245 [Xylaria multiplex]
MDESLKKYLGKQKSAALEKYLDDLTAKPGARPFVGFGTWLCDDNYRVQVDAAGINDSLWTHVFIAVEGVFSKSLAQHTLRNIDKEIRGTLPPSSGSLEGQASEESGNLDITPLGSPRGGYIVNTNFVEVELGSEDEPPLIATPHVAS